jgi:hypothetical protein
MRDAAREAAAQSKSDAHGWLASLASGAPNHCRIDVRLFRFGATLMAISAGISIFASHKQRAQNANETPT